MNSNEKGITVAELALYYDLRRQNFGAGYNDRMCKRAYKPISQKEKKEEISRKRFVCCLGEEINLRGLEVDELQRRVGELEGGVADISLERTYWRFDSEATQDELEEVMGERDNARRVARRMLEEINSYRAQLGLPRDDGKGKDKF
jgi:uncharacterized coiled-coil DUF342 family protein